MDAVPIDTTGNASSEKPVHIDVSQIPKVELDILCATFLEAVQRFYEDPENRRRFEEWRSKRNGGTNNDRSQSYC